MVTTHLLCPSILIFWYIVKMRQWSDLFYKINLQKFWGCDLQLSVLTWSCVDNNVKRVSNAALRTEDIVWCKNGQTRGTKTVSDCWILTKKTQINLTHSQLNSISMISNINAVWTWWWWHGSFINKRSNFHEYSLNIHSEMLL